MSAISDFLRDATQVNSDAAGNIAATDVQAALEELDTEKLATTLKGAASGLAELDAGGKVPVAQLPATVLGAVQYQGTWNATTNTPALTNGGVTEVAEQGDYFVVSVAGSTSIDGITDWVIGDWIIFNGTTYEKVDNTANVTSIFSRTGAVTAATSDYDADQIDNTPAGNLAASDVQAALNELQGDIDTINSSLSSLTASEVANVAAGNLAATDVQAALDELQGDIDTINALSSMSNWVAKTTTYTAVAKDRIMADTDTTAAFTITLPAAPSVGEEIIIRDAVGNAGIDNITLDRNSKPIGGLAEDLTIDIAWAEVHLVWYDATTGWSVA